MNHTEIRWTELTWNPASGCVKVSPGCKHCYAETLAENKRGTPAFPNGFDLTLRPHKLREPFRVPEPSLIFVNSMSDLFWDQIPESYRDQVVDVIEATPWHEYQVLTKRHDELVRYSKRRPLPGNFWAGVTAENQEWLDIRATALREVKADIRFISMEPALEEMSLLSHIDSEEFDNSIGGNGIQWVIYGGESGAHLTKPKHQAERSLVEPSPGGNGWVPRLDRIGWAHLIQLECENNGVPFFFKQWGGPRSTSGGKHLNGQTYEEYPRLPGELIPDHNAREQIRKRLGGAAAGAQVGLPVVS